jgi:hypothetical protein
VRARPWHSVLTRPCSDAQADALAPTSCGIKGLLDHVCEGFSATALAYGPTGSGKTYTIAGKPDSIIKNGSGDASDGIVIRAVEALFDKIRSLQRDGLQFKVRGSSLSRE